MKNPKFRQVVSTQIIETVSNPFGEGNTSEVLITDGDWRVVENTDGIEKWIYVERCDNTEADNLRRTRTYEWNTRTYVLWVGTPGVPTLGLGLFPGNCKAVLANPKIPQSIKNVVEAYMLMNI